MTQLPLFPDLFPIPIEPETTVTITPTGRALGLVAVATITNPSAFAHIIIPKQTLFFPSDLPLPLIAFQTKTAKSLRNKLKPLIREKYHELTNRRKFLAQENPFVQNPQ